jgi:AcrR family transcriptional regulator
MNQVVHLAPKKAHKTKTASSKVSARALTRTNDPERTMAGILEVATVEFAEKGLDGARIDEIAAATKTSKRMIYYYFSSKEGLYRAVLEDMYRRMRSIESGLHLTDLPPVEALQKLVGFTFDHHHDNQNFIRLVMSENMQRGAYLSQSKSIQDLNVPAIAAIQELYDRGVASGVFRTGLDPVDIHASISALTFFNVSNQHTFGLIFNQDPASPNAIAVRRKNIIDMVLRFMLA